MKSSEIFSRLVLIGFRGAGKTTLGQHLAKALPWEYISTDLEIERHAGRRIADMVGDEGWAAFRKRERAVISRLRDRRKCIIDCGGGVVMDPLNMADLVPSSLVVWVDAELPDILERLAAGDRPLLNQTNLFADARENYHRRRPLYEQYGQLRINTSGESVPAAALRVLECMGVYGE